MVSRKHVSQIQLQNSFYLHAHYDNILSNSSDSEVIESTSVAPSTCIFWWCWVSWFFSARSVLIALRAWVSSLSWSTTRPSSSCFVLEPQRDNITHCWGPYLVHPTWDPTWFILPETLPGSSYLGPYLVHPT